MTAGAASGRETPAPEASELVPWRRLCEEVRRVLVDEATCGWVTVAAGSAPPADGVPLLADASITVDLRQCGPWLRGLVERAAAGDGPAATLRADRLTDARVVALLGAAIAEDGARIAALAGELDAEPGALAAVASLGVMPLLHGCRQALAGVVPAGWTHGHCPVCGAWPTLAEARGVERSRHYCCGRCGTGWPAGWLRCPYCGNGDHLRAGALVGAEPGARHRVETCEVCRGYVKTLTVLLPIETAGIALADLDSLALDLAALAHGYQRPAAPGRVGSPHLTAGRFGHE